MFFHTTDAKLVVFDGTDLVRVKIIPVLTTHVNDISLRFKTPKPDGLLFQTANEYTNDFLKVALEAGRGKLLTNLGGRTEVKYSAFITYSQVWEGENM